MNSTYWERSLQASGTPIITWNHKAIVDYLLSVFRRDEGELLLNAACDDTRRHSLQFALNPADFGGVNFGGTAHYSKKKRRFTFIQYSDRHNYMVRFSIASPQVYWAAHPRFSPGEA